MKVAPIDVDAIQISEMSGLDATAVFWCDYGQHRGSVTITCYPSGRAWTARFGGMPSDTIREFFLCADADYLVNKLGYAPTLKERNTDMVYLRRIVDAVKAALNVLRGSEAVTNRE